MDLHRYFIYLAYDGTSYHGWQVQPNGSSVQEIMMRSLSTLLRTETDVLGAGRTDAGVHARLMVAHFDSKKQIDCNILTDKLNRFLPPDISVYRIREVKPQANARFDAIYRTYQYYVTTVKSPFSRLYCHRLFISPDFEKMNESARLLFEYSDFTSFSKLHTDVKTNNCKVMKAEWQKIGTNEWVFIIQANRFLRNMVRAIVGTLFDVGYGKLSVDDFRQVIEKRTRAEAGSSVPANALFLVDIGYPEDLFV